MALKNCPACGHDSIFLPLIPAAGYDGTLHGSRSEGFCNSPRCDQLLWYYPHTGRVTRRTVGINLKEYTERRWERRFDLDFINTWRKEAGLRLLIEAPVAVMVLPGEVGPESFRLKIEQGKELTWYDRVVDVVLGRYYLLLAAIKSPFQTEAEDDG